ncbi:dnaJ homolog subfamily C member 3-like [Mytilus edulis]|uniref:dnaJ homolog subfamily C member 3-like n=1 Tax=Mytilus edulis TaxID=6550 RepID=UPI0039EFE9E6
MMDCRKLWSSTNWEKSFVLFLLSLDICLIGVYSANKDVEEHLAMGKKLLAAGQLAEALSHYHAAVDGDRKNYLTYFRRATVYLALGKSKSALPDLDKVMELKPDFTAARLQRGNVLLKQGKLQEARQDYETVLKKDPSNEEAQQQLQLLSPIHSDILTAKDFYANKQYDAAIDILGRVVDICPWDAELREIRSDCYLAVGDNFKAISDIRSTTKLISDNTNAYLKLSQIHYTMGDAEDSLVQIRECLKLDQEHKECKKHYTKVKKLVKQLNSAQEFKNEKKYQECVDKAKQILKTEPNEPEYLLKAYSYLCHCDHGAGHIKEGFKDCDTVLTMDPENVDAVIDKAETHISNEEFDEAIRLFQDAQNKDQESRRIRDGMNRAQKLKKQSQRRDYYKILGVKRTASKKQILKAYKKLAMKWHPDKYEGDDKEMAQKKFIDIASAKEVLTDPDKRNKFDNGEDPLDPESQQGQGFNPFGQGFNPFGGGGGGGGQGFNFKFHF